LLKYSVTRLLSVETKSRWVVANLILFMYIQPENMYLRSPATGR